MTLNLEPLPRVQLPWGWEHATDHGELLIGSYPDFLFGRAALSEAAGTPEAPLRIGLRPCGFVVVAAEFSRPIASAEEERLSFVLFDDGGEEAVAAYKADERGFIVLEPGEGTLQARLDGHVLSSARVTGRLLEIVTIRLTVPLPILEPDMEEEGHEDPSPALTVHGLVTSAENHHYPSQLYLHAPVGRRGDCTGSDLDQGGETLARSLRG